MRRSVILSSGSSSVKVQLDEVGHLVMSQLVNEGSDAQQVCVIDFGLADNTSDILNAIRFVLGKKTR